MSKKIIYLLSLLMALSLVFASCKKNNGVTGIQGDTNQEDEIKENTGGLKKTWDELANETILNDYAVIGESGGDYYRNPIIVTIGKDGGILIIAEQRINFPGSANDIGVNGEKPVQIVYLTSTDAGDNFTAPQPVGPAVSDANNAVSAPVVYKSSDGSKIYIIASAGVGISRANQLYSQRGKTSQLKYISGSVAGSTVTWDPTWKDLKISDLGLDQNTQFGTHSARGVVDNSGNLILAVITADQGINGNPGKDSAHEMMGVIFYKIDPSNFTPTKIGQTITFKENKDYFTKYKEARAVAINGEVVDYLAVPSPYNNNYTMGAGKSDSASDPTAVSGLTGSEGSFGFLYLKGSWYGANQYDPSKYVDNPTAAGDPSASGSDAKLFSHVKSQAGENHLRLLSAGDGYAPINAKTLRIAKTGKSSSIDVLPDGTIIVAAEKERNTAAEGLKFNIFFSRYTQKYLAEQLQ